MSPRFPSLATRFLMVAGLCVLAAMAPARLALAQVDGAPSPRLTAPGERHGAGADIHAGQGAPGIPGAPLEPADPQARLGEAPAHGSGGLPQLRIETWPGQIFWLAVAFIVLYVWLRRRAVPVLDRTIEDRNQTIRADLDAARQANEHAQASASAKIDALRAARDQARQVIETAEAGIRERLAAEEAAAAAKAEQQVAAAEAQVRAAHQTARGQLAGEARALVAPIVERLAGIHPDDAQLERALQAALPAGNAA